MSAGSGFELKVLRMLAGVRQRELAAVLGVPQQRISAIERARCPTPRAAQAYLQALSKVVTVR